MGDIGRKPIKQGKLCGKGLETVEIRLRERQFDAAAVVAALPAFLSANALLTNEKMNRRGRSCPAAVQLVMSGAFVEAAEAQRRPMAAKSQGKWTGDVVIGHAQNIGAGAFENIAETGFRSGRVAPKLPERVRGRAEIETAKNMFLIHAVGC